MAVTMGAETATKGLEAILNEIRNEISSVKDIVTKTREDFIEVRAQIGRLEEENVFLKDEVKRLDNAGVLVEDRVIELEKYSRKNNVIISGIPYDKEENVESIVHVVAREAKVKLREFDICAAHRLHARNKVPDIIVKFLCNEKKNELIKSVKKCKLEIQGIKIYVSDHLLGSTKVLLNEAKQLRREGRIQFVWTRNGDLFVKRTENDRSKKILFEEDLNEFRCTETAATEAKRHDTTSKRTLEERSPQFNGNATLTAKKLPQSAQKRFARSRQNSQSQPDRFQTTLDQFKTGKENSTGPTQRRPNAADTGFKGNTEPVFN